MGRHFVQQVSQKGFPLHPYPLKIYSRYFIGLRRVCGEVIHLFHHDCHGRFHRQRGTDQDNIEYYKLLFFLSRSQSGRVTACGSNITFPRRCCIARTTGLNLSYKYYGSASTAVELEVGAVIRVKKCFRSGMLGSSLVQHTRTTLVCSCMYGGKPGVETSQLMCLAERRFTGVD